MQLLTMSALFLRQINFSLVVDVGSCLTWIRALFSKCMEQNHPLEAAICSAGQDILVF